MFLNQQFELELKYYSNSAFKRAIKRHEYLKRTIM